MYILTKTSTYLTKIILVFFETILLFFILNNIIKLPVQAQEAIGLSIEKFVDKEHIQLYKPEEGERDITYTINIVTNGYCNANLDLVIVFDRSGSMGSHMDVTKQATVSFIGELDAATDNIALASYSYDATLDQPLTSDFQDVIESVNALIADGNTNVGAALLTADQELLDNAREDTDKVILIFTDGRNNYPPDSNEAVYTIADGIKDNHDTRIISVGIGDNIDEVFLQTIASSLDDYYWVEDTDDLEETFINIARSLQYGNANIQVSDNLSDLLEYSDFIEASDGGYLDGNILKWDFGVDICRTETKNVNFILRVKEDTPDLTNLINSAVVSDLGSERHVISNEVSTIIHAPLLEIQKLTINEYILAGGDVTYQIILYNYGSGNAYGIEVIDDIPANFLEVYQGSISDSGYLSGSSIIWDNEGRGYTLNGYFDPEYHDALNSGHVFSYKVRVASNISSGEEIINTAIMYSNDRSKAIETQSHVTVSSILAATGQDIYDVYIFFVLFLIFSVGVFLYHRLKCKN